MDFKDIMVHIDNSEQSVARLELAIYLARKFGAHLTGLYVITHPHYASQNESMMRKISEAEAMFRLGISGADISAEWFAADWATIGVSMAEVFNYYAHSKDLVIVGQSDPGVRDGYTPVDFPEQVVSGAGRPVLVVPFAGAFSTVGERVIVAWKAGRESARAVNDAMPFLLTAGQVNVVAIEHYGGRLPAEKNPLADICSNLERHDIQFRQETLVTGKIPVAKLLMDYAWENGCDLMVLGVPRAPQSRGPVARQIFDQMTVPVLMAY